MALMPEKMYVTSELEKNLIFQNLKKLNIPINIISGGVEYRGTVEKLTNDGIIVKLETPLINEIDQEVRVNFAFNNNYHYFTGPATMLDSSKVLIIVPEKISKNILRKHKRIRVYEKVYMRFKIIVKAERSISLDASRIDERVILQEVKKPKPAIDKVLSGIKNLVSEFSQKFQVKVFKSNEKLNFEEELVKDSGKIFLIYDSYEDAITERRFFEEKILTIGRAFEYLISKGMSRKEAEDKLLDLLQEKRDNKIYSECFVPLLLEGEVVGYIRLQNDMEYHRNIKPLQALRVLDYATLLVEALVKYDYFRLESGMDYDIPLVDISAGGMLFKLTKPQLKRYLTVGTFIQASIKFPSRYIEVMAEIFRIDQANLLYGCKFKEINEEDMNWIEDLAKKKNPL
ncbi:MAG: hypothetical protein DRP54_07215 [Spirochaetes bacterium]|nr:MAG: hypothetical protein DRP54_07215 [Spirochaetota bacterium]